MATLWFFRLSDAREPGENWNCVADWDAC